MKCRILIPRPPLWAIPEKISKQGMGRGDGGDGEGDGGWGNEISKGIEKIECGNSRGQ